MRVKLVRDAGALIPLKEEWNSLLKRSPTNHVFMTWEWAVAWWRHFGQGRQLFILVVEDGGEVAGILPLMLFVSPSGRASRTRYLHLLGFRFEQRWNDWMDIIAVNREKVLSAALDYLRRCQYQWDVLDLWDIPEDSETIHILTDIAKQMGFSVGCDQIEACPYISTRAGWENYRHTYPPGKIAKDLERQTKRLHLRGNLTFERTTASSLLATLDALFDLHQRRFNLSMFHNDAYRCFYRSLASMFPLDELDCSAMRLDGKVIAAHFGFRYNHRFYYCTPAFDPDYSQFSPGKILLRHIVAECFSDSRVLEFDFLRGDEPYKSEWATGRRWAYRIRLGNEYATRFVGKIVRRMPLYARRLVMSAFSSS